MYSIQFPYRAVAVVGPQRSGKTTLLLSHAANMSKFGSNKILFLCAMANLSSDIETLREMGANMSNIQVLSFDANNDLPQPSELGTVIFAIDSVIYENRKVCSYLPISVSTYAFLQKLNDPNMLMPFVLYSAHDHNAISVENSGL